MKDNEEKEWTDPGDSSDYKYKKEEPRCIEASVSTSWGTKIQLVKYELSQDSHISMSRRYSIPEGWDDATIDEFQVAKYLELTEKVDELAQREADTLMAQRDELNK